MKYAVAATAFLFTLGRAQDGLTDVISQIPTCALNCLTQGISGAGCGLDDFECTCSNFESISNDVQPCLGNSECTDTEAADTVRLAANLCNSIGSESASVTVTTATETGSETPSNLETIPVASETETLTTTVGSETVTVSSSSEESGSVTTTVTDASETTTATESETTTASGADASASDASASDAAATESGSEGDDDSAAGRVQAAGWAVAGVIAAAIAL